jgi:hypothetical protein
VRRLHGWWSSVPGWLVNPKPARWQGPGRRTATQSSTTPGSTSMSAHKPDSKNPVRGSTQRAWRVPQGGRSLRDNDARRARAAGTARCDVALSCRTCRCGRQSRLGGRNGSTARQQGQCGCCRRHKAERPASSSRAPTEGFPSARVKCANCSRARTIHPVASIRIPVTLVAEDGLVLRLVCVNAKGYIRTRQGVPSNSSEWALNFTSMGIGVQLPRRADPVRRQDPPTFPLVRPSAFDWPIGQSNAGPFGQPRPSRQIETFCSMRRRRACWVGHKDQRCALGAASLRGVCNPQLPGA